MEICTGVHRIDSAIGDRPLYLYLFVGDRTVLLDAGVATTPREVILPYMRSLSLGPDDLDLVIISHADGDHCGGVAAMRELAPRTSIVCGLPDRAMVEDPAVLIEERVQAYRDRHGIALLDEQLVPLRPLMGAPARVDIALAGGARLGLASGWDIEVLHTPGHSAGHLAVHDRRSNVLFTADAVHGRYYPNFAGDPAMPPNYIDVHAYLETLGRLEQLDAQGLFSAHWPGMTGPAVAKFLVDSRDYVQQLERIVEGALADVDHPLALLDVIARVTEQLGQWSAGGTYELAFSVEAHLEHLVLESRAIRMPLDGRRVGYTGADREGRRTGRN